MNINNDSNISSIVSQHLARLNLSSLNRSNKVNENSENNDKIIEDESKNQIINDNEDVSDQEIQKPKMNVNVADIQKYANLMGENLSTEDINYGLMYGRSVIADYSV